MKTLRVVNSNYTGAYYGCSFDHICNVYTSPVVEYSFIKPGFKLKINHNRDGK